MLGLIHYNPNLPHQVAHARAFEACGFKATTRVDAPADLHVVSGPWYALDHWRDHPNLLVIDRAFWGDPDRVLIGWMQPNHVLRYATGTAPRDKPTPAPWKTRECSALVLADYQEDVTATAAAARTRFGYVRIRRHPAERVEQVSLEAHLALCDVAIGRRGSALTTAVIAGLPGICLDKHNAAAPVCAASLDAPLVRPDRSAWLHDLSYRQFTLDEIADGTAWNILKTAR